MAAFEVIALDTATPQLRAPGAGDTYSLPRSAAMAASTSFGWAGATLWSSGSNVIEQYNSTNAQTLNIYNTRTDASNYERGFVRWSSNAFQIGLEAAGSGSLRYIDINSASATATLRLTNPAAGGTTIINFKSNANSQDGSFSMDSAGNMIFRNQTGGSQFFDVYNGIVYFRNVSGGYSTSLTIDGSGNLTLRDGGVFALGTTNGNKIGSSASQKLGFWNATPIVQPSTAVSAATRVGGGGAAVTDTDTFDGYTIAQITKALRNTGLLA